MSNRPYYNRTDYSAFEDPTKVTFDSNLLARLALQVHHERMRLSEALGARDVAVQRLADACAAINIQSVGIEKLQTEKEELEKKIATLEMKHHELQDAKTEEISTRQPSAQMDAGLQQFSFVTRNRQLSTTSTESTLTAVATGSMEDTMNSALQSPRSPEKGSMGESDVHVQNRLSILAALPLPPGLPEDALKPIKIPATSTLEEFLATFNFRFQPMLGQYQILNEDTTMWCPEREEHGCLLTPLFKCTTNPRAAMVHGWNMMDIANNGVEPTEYFYCKEGKWYYAGTYTSFRLEDLAPEEWPVLPKETQQSLIKETLAGRRNCAPAHSYETGELYAVGALKVACVGMQCVGFNALLYTALLSHAERLATCGPLRRSSVSTGGLRLGSSWNTAITVSSEGTRESRERLAGLIRPRTASAPLPRTRKGNDENAPA